MEFWKSVNKVTLESTFQRYLLLQRYLLAFSVKSIIPTAILIEYLFFLGEENDALKFKPITIIIKYLQSRPQLSEATK